MKTVRFKQIKAVYEVCETVSKFITPLYRFTNSHDVAVAFQFLKEETKESFYAVHLDSKNRALCVDLVSVGSLNASIVHPREVFKSALLSSAAAILFVHNHPSGDPEPSGEDLDLTSRLKEAAEILGIRVLDHIIIGERHISLADRGLL